MNDIKNDTHEIVNMWTAMNQENHWRIEEIAELKMPDLTAASMDAAVNTLAGSARSMGIEVED